MRDVARAVGGVAVAAVLIYTVVTVTGLAGGFVTPPPAAQASPQGRSPSPTPTATPTPTPSPTVSPSPCHVRGVLPDPACTPGATNPDVTQDNLDTTVCHPGWSTQHRPPVKVTNRIKHTVMNRYGYAGQSPAGFELDHLIPISIGGALADPKNLWPETPPSPNPKDRVEAAALHALCAGQIALADAQTGFARDWTALAARLHVH